MMCDLSSENCLNDISRENLAQILNIKGSIPENIEYFFVDSNGAKIKYTESDFICSNYDINGNIYADGVVCNDLNSDNVLIFNDIDFSTNISIGDEVCIKDECFYVISDDNSLKVSLLAKYNLEVGNKCIDDKNAKYHNYTCSAIENPSGIQCSTCKGFDDWTFKHTDLNGAIGFSNSTYWLDSNKSLKSEYGEVDGLVYIFDNNSKLMPYINNYKNYLIGLGANINNIRLIELGELKKLGCNTEKRDDYYTCENAPMWVYSSSYWTGSWYSEDELFDVYTEDVQGNDPGYVISEFYKVDSAVGLRPVIEIKIDEFTKKR